MEQRLNNDVLAMFIRNRRYRRWKQIVGVMMCIVVFCTTYMLILPAIAKDGDTFCGLEEHAHNEFCYESVLVCTESTESGHVHTEACAPVTEIIQICALEETDGHAHTENCYTTEQILVCTLEESEEHTHTESCYTTEQILSCTLEETQAHIHSESCFTTTTTYNCGLEETPVHVHAESCYEVQQICQMEEHTHSLQCYSDPNADLESAAVWEQTLPAVLSGIYAEDLIAVAKSQLGYCESERNYIVENETEIKGYTRYGAWYGIPYGDWNAMFVSFCLHYSRIGDVPVDANCGSWISVLDSQGMFRSADSHTPQAGDLIFFDRDGDNSSDHVGLVAEYIGGESYDTAKVRIIEGDSGNAVAYNVYAENDAAIMGYGIVIDDPTRAEQAAVSDLMSRIEQLPSADEFERIMMEYEEAGDLDGQDSYYLEISCMAEDLYYQYSQMTESQKALVNNIDTLMALEHLWNTSQPAEDPEATTPDAESSGSSDAIADIVSQGSEESDTGLTQQESSNLLQAQTLSTVKSTAVSTYTARSTTLDMTEWINKVTMYKVENDTTTEIPNGTVVYEGDLIQFMIEYTIPGQELATMNEDGSTNVISDTVTYQIPSAFKTVESDQGYIKNSAGQTVGTYTIEGNTITMVYNEDYLEENAEGKQIHGYISFFSVVDKVTADETENQEFQFNDTNTVNFNVQESQEAVGDLSVRKRATEINGDVISYRISVSSEEGTNGPITLTDIMCEALTYVEGTLTVKSGGQDVDFTGDLSAMTLPEMSEGENYIINYDVKVDMDLIGADMTVDNTVTVSGKDSRDVPLEDSATVTHTFDVLKKTGTLNDDGTITWNIAINNAKLDISGWQLIDVITNAQGTTNYTGTVNILDSAGNVFAANVTLPYVFPKGSTDIYTITYTTSHKLAEGDTITNKAILKNDDVEITEVEGVGVGSPIVKTGEISGEVTQAADGTWHVPVKWTVTIDTSRGEIPAGYYFTDKMNGYPSDDMYVTYDQLMNIYNHFRTVVSNAGGSVGQLQATTFVPGPYSSGTTYSQKELEANKDGCQSEMFEQFWIRLDKAIPQGQTLTFTYETMGIFPDNLVSNVTYKNRFNINDQYEVEGETQYTAGNVRAIKYALKYYDPDSEVTQDWSMDWNGVGGTPSRFDYENLKQNYLAWAIDLMVPSDYGGSGDIVIYEDLPEGVTVRSMDISFLDNIPSSRLELDNMVVGQTYTLSATVYPDINQYSVWPLADRTGGVVATITVKVTESGDLEITFPEEMLRIMATAAQTQSDNEWWCMFYIYTQINEDFAWTPTHNNELIYRNTFENKFTIEDSSGKTVDMGSQSQIITRDDSVGNVLKSASYDDNFILYQVVLNPNGLNLDPYTDTLSITDTLTYPSTADKQLKMNLVAGSVKLYEYLGTDTNGNVLKGESVNFAYQYDESAVTDSAGTTTRTHVITLTIPDKTPVVLEYEYFAVGDKTSHSLTNTCTIDSVGDGGITGDSSVELQVVQSTASANIKGVVLYKVDLDNNGIYLPGAKFNLYIWNEAQNRYIPHTSEGVGITTFITNENGQLEPALASEYISYNTAYYLVEVEAPEGYYLLNEPYYFYVSNADTEAFPACMPDGFIGSELKDGDIIYLKNESAQTEISIQKNWLDHNGSSLTVTADQVASIRFELWQKLEGVEGSDKLYGTYTVTPDENGFWEETITGLPKGIMNEADGTKGTLYQYYIKEVTVPGYTVDSYENNAGITNGTITVTNREAEGYELPKTGGAGTHRYTVAGWMLLSTSAAFLLYRYKKRRKEAT